MLTNKKFSIIIFFVYLFAFFLVSIPSLFIYKLLHKAKENTTIEKIVKFQLEKDAIYNPLDFNMLQYKLELIKNKKPEIIALGSSRVMQFREESFNTKFITAGGAMNFLNEGYSFLKEMTKYHKPRLIILGLDFWWFNENYYQPSLVNNLEEKSTNIKDKINKILSDIIKNEIDFKIFKYISRDKNDITNYQNIGIRSLEYSNGFRKDGSYQYSQFILGDKENSDISFSNTFNRIDNGNRRFEYANHISKERVEIFNKIIKFAKNNDIKLILFIPPLANEVVEKMDNLGNKYNYINEFRNLINNTGIEHYDFHDMRNYYKDSCEFVDGFHAGDVTYQRILAKMYDSNSSISKYLNIDLIRKFIDDNKGKTLTIFDRSKYKVYKENDYLELGCVK